MYTFLPEFGGTHDRIHAYNPDVKLLYVMRDPVERMLSNYAFRRVRRLTADPPEVALITDPTFVNRSRYGMQLRPYFDRFPAEQIHLMVFEEHVADTSGSLKEVAGFLGDRARRLPVRRPQPPSTRRPASPGSATAAAA